MSQTILEELNTKERKRYIQECTKYKLCMITILHLYSLQHVFYKIDFELARTHI